MQGIIHKKKLRVLSAILIAALVLSLGILVPPITGQSSDSEVHAVQNDSLLSVTLTGAKTTQFQDYWRVGDRFWKPNPADVSGYSRIIVQRGSAEANQLKTDPATGLPLYSYLYDSASLWVYSTATEEWTQIAADSLYDSDAHDLAIHQRTAKYTSDLAALNAIQPRPLDYLDQEARIDAQYEYDVQTIDWTKYVKTTPSFDFRFDSKHNGKLATIVYTNTAQTKADYGNLPSQALGGYFGDINDYANFNTNLETFTLATGSKKFDLKKAVYLTLKVTPVSTPWDGDNFNAAAETWTRTDGAAYLIQSNAGGAADNLEVNALSANSQRFNGATYENVYHFTNPKTGTYVFPALEGQKLIFRGTGEYQDGAKKQNGAAKNTRPFQAQWLGGYKNLDIVGNPKNLKKIAVGTADKTVGTIKLTKGAGKIQGTISGMNTGHVQAGGVVGDHYESGQLQRDTVAASFSEYAAFMENKTLMEVSRVTVDNSVPSNETEYLNGAAGYTVSRALGTTVNEELTVVNNAIVEISKAEYDNLPAGLKPAQVTYGTRSGTEGKVWIGPKADDYRYFKYNWVEITGDAYFALPAILQACHIDMNQYWQKAYLTDISQADYTALNPDLQGGTYVATDGVTHYLKANYSFRKSPTPIPATEAEYEAYISAPEGDGNGRVYDGGPVSVNAAITGYVEITQAEYDALPAYWDAGIEKRIVNGKYYRMNMTEVTADVFNTLPTFLRHSSYDAATTSTKYFQNQYYTPIDAATYDALPDPSIGVRYLAPTGVYQYYKENLTYEKAVVTYAYWKDTAIYTIENLASGVYFVEFGGQVKVITVKNGKTTSANFKQDLKNPNTPQYLTEITGTKAKGKKLTAKTRIIQPGFGQSQAKYKYYWTNGTKILSKKAAYKVSKSYAKKNLWVLSVATFKKYQTVSGNAWTAAPGNTYGVIGFDVTVTGTFKSGKKVTAVVTNEQVSGVKYSYQWLRNGKAINKATKSSYKITKADKNKKISVKVTGTVEGYTSKSVKSKATKSK